MKIPMIWPKMIKLNTIQLCMKFSVSRNILLLIVLFTSFSFEAKLISKVKNRSFFTDEYLPAGQASAHNPGSLSYFVSRKSIFRWSLNKRHKNRLKGTQRFYL